MPTATVQYLGNLRTSAVHSESQVKIITDAPKDNNGNGESFSPTDLTAVSLASCMLTLMGITARKKGIDFNEASATVLKNMAEAPRRIDALDVEIQIKDENFSDKQRAILENAARSCPVAKSLHPDIAQRVSFKYL